MHPKPLAWLLAQERPFLKGCPQGTGAKGQIIARPHPGPVSTAAEKAPEVQNILMDTNCSPSSL